MINKYLFCSTIILAFFTINCVYAQNGIIKGNIKEEGTNTPLPSATIYVENTGLGTVTDVNGDFLLNNVPVGEQIVTISFLGFETKEQTVSIVSGKVVEIDVSLGFASITGETVVVTGQLLGQAKAINQQLNSATIASIVAADKIQSLPDVNAAEAIARLPGVAIQRSGGEGQKVIIRGMEPKFAAITVNGVRLPSNSGNDRSVDLSMISPEMLDGIEVFKAPLPDMDAESVGGTVNLKLRKAPKDLKLLGKLLGGYNQLNDDFGDYKGVVQASRRFFNDKLGVVAQGSMERFNRGGDIIVYDWEQGGTNEETGITTIRGDDLILRDRQETRKRINGSANLDYDLGKHSLALFGLYSNTTRDRFVMQNSYSPNQPSIGFRGSVIEDEIDLYSIALSGEHPFGKLLVDWSLSTSQTQGNTPYDFYMDFGDANGRFDPDLNASGQPSTFLAAARPDLENIFLSRNEFESRETLEETRTAFVNFKIPLNLGEKIGGYFKFGGKYFAVDRDRSVNLQSENFYYLGGEFTNAAAAAYQEATKGDALARIALNPSLINISNFTTDAPQVDFETEDGTSADFSTALNPDLIREWYDIQESLLTNNRTAINNNFEVTETISAAYAMLKLEFGKKLTIIPGFRYEYSDNEYRAGISSINGRYGVNGFFLDSTTVQQYGEFLPHLHIKYKPTDWFDIRASYANTLARPNYNFVTPRAQINNTSTNINAGNPRVSHARSTSYDIFLSFFKGGLGLFTVGGFYKDVENIFVPWRINLSPPEVAVANGWNPDIFGGYNLNSYTNLPTSTVYGFEMDLQTNLGFLPKPFNGILLSANYARLYSTTEVFFQTVESRLISRIPPIVEEIFNTSTREVSMPTQAPHILNMTFGYEIKKFSARLSSIFQGTKARRYDQNKDFDEFDLSFWRWDASIKQGIGERFSVFLNLNNISNQQDIQFTRNENFINQIETFGRTFTMGLQYQIR